MRSSSPPGGCSPAARLYVDPGSQPLSDLAAERAKRRAIANLRALGYDVTLQETDQQGPTAEEAAAS